MIAVYIGILIVIIYTITLCIKNKQIPPSISETYYMGGGIWFTLSLFIAAFCLVIGLLDLSENKWWLFVSFFTGAGIGFVGAAPCFHESFEGKVHFVGAVTLLLGSQIWLLLIGCNPLVYLLWLPSLIWKNTKQLIFWCEITCMVTMAIGLLTI